MTRIKNKGLDVKPAIEFPLNTNRFIRPGGGPGKAVPRRGEKKWKRGGRKQFISAEIILNNPRMQKKYEKRLGYM